MARKRRRREERASAQTGLSPLGVAWYKSEQWSQLRAVAADFGELEETYEEWRANAESSIADLTSTGALVERVEIDMGELVRWCHSEGTPVDSAARARFAALKLRQMHEQKRRI